MLSMPFLIFMTDIIVNTFEIYYWDWVFVIYIYINKS